MKEKNIDILLAHQLLGTITEDEKCILDSWLDESEENGKVMDALRDGPFSVAEYRKYASVDSDRAWDEFRKRNHRKRFSMSYRQVMPAVAVVLCLVVLSVTALWYADYTRVTPPKLSSNVIAAIEKSIESGYAENMMGSAEGTSVLMTDSVETISAEQLKEYGLDMNDVDEILKNRSIETLRDRESWLRLDDGTIVHLSANSRIIYPEHFKKTSLFTPNAKREVIVEGEAYFMVAHDNSRQFIVHTRHGDITDYGTEFFVATSDKSTKVALVEGSVGFTPQGKEEVMMKPGEEATVVNNDLSLSDKNMEEYKAWNTGKYFFEDESLESVAHVVKIWDSLNITFADDEVQNMHISGSFDRYNKIEDLIDAICDVMGLQWTRKDANTILISR